MKKILEYRVFDILKDPENEKFLDKVKKENPDEYTRFLNLIGNKGLEVAKQKYQIYDPEYKKQQLEIEKAEKARRKKLGRKELKKEIIQGYLFFNKDKIDEIENLLLNSPLKKFETFIKRDSRISNYLESCKAKKHYKNEFKDLLKNPRFRRVGGIIKVDSLRFSTTNFSYETGERETDNIINIVHWYNLDTKKSLFNLTLYSFDMSPESNYFPKIDHNKEASFLRQRKELFKDKLSKNNIDETELYSTLFKEFSVYFDERFYKDWYEKWKLNQSVNKFNI